MAGGGEAEGRGRSTGHADGVEGLSCVAGCVDADFTGEFVGVAAAAAGGGGGRRVGRALVFAGRVLLA